MLPFIVRPFTTANVHRTIWMPLITCALLTAFLFLACPGRTQQIAGPAGGTGGSGVAGAAGPNDSCVAIRSFSGQIDADSSLHQLVLDKREWGGDEVTDGRGKLTGYFRGDTLCKMRLSVGLSYAIVKESYYFSGGALVLVEETEDDYPSGAHPGPNHARPVRTFDGWYYFAGDKAFKTILWGKKHMGPDDIHHPLELYHNAHYYYGLMMHKKAHLS